MRRRTEQAFMQKKQQSDVASLDRVLLIVEYVVQSVTTEVYCHADV